MLPGARAGRRTPGRQAGRRHRRARRRHLPPVRPARVRAGRRRRRTTQCVEGRAAAPIRSSRAPARSRAGPSRRRREHLQANTPTGLDTRSCTSTGSIAPRAAIRLANADVTLTTDRPDDQEPALCYLADLPDQQRIEFESLGDFTDRYSPVESISPTHDHDGPAGLGQQHLGLGHRPALVPRRTDVVPGELAQLPGRRPGSGTSTRRPASSTTSPPTGLTRTTSTSSCLGWRPSSASVELTTSRSSGLAFSGHRSSPGHRGWSPRPTGTPTSRTASTQGRPTTTGPTTRSPAAPAAARCSSGPGTTLVPGAGCRAGLGREPTSRSPATPSATSGRPLSASATTSTRRSPVWVSVPATSRSIGNVFTEDGGHGVAVGGVLADAHHPSDLRMTNKDILIEDNTVNRVSVDYKDNGGILSTYVTNAQIVHNEVANVPYDGIDTGYGWGINDAGGSDDYVDRGYYKLATRSTRRPRRSRTTWCPATWSTTPRRDSPTVAGLQPVRQPGDRGREQLPVQHLRRRPLPRRGHPVHDLPAQRAPGRQGVDLHQRLQPEQQHQRQPAARQLVQLRRDADPQCGGAPQPADRQRKVSGTDWPAGAREVICAAGVAPEYRTRLNANLFGFTACPG